MDVKTLALEQLPDPGAIAVQIEDDPLQPIRAELEFRAVVVTDGIEEVPAPDTDAARKLMLDGARALRKLQNDREAAELTEDESDGLEAVVHAVARPAILVQKNTFGEPPKGWEILEETRASIERAIPSVGRIEIHGHPQIGAWGTGWVVGENLVMTNRHVINGFDDIENYIFTLGTPHIDYLEEDGNPERAEFRIKSAVVHETLDLALVRVEKLDASPLEPPPLRISGTPPLASINVYAIGYPVTPGETPPNVLAAIFNNKFGVKRLQPGLLTVIHDDKPKIEHDASTLGGSSGSPVIDLERDLVVGLHYSGKYKKRNNAVALWKLTDDKLLKDHGIQFH